MSSKKKETPEQDEIENDLIRAAAAAARFYIDEIERLALYDQETDAKRQRVLDLLDAIHDAKQRKVGLQ